MRDNYKGVARTWHLEEKRLDSYKLGKLRRETVYRDAGPLPPDLPLLGEFAPCRLGRGR